MTNSFQDMATRAVNAENSFVADIMEIAEITEEEGHKVLALYLKEKIAKMDYGIGRVQIKHGAFLDAATIRRAASI